MLKQNWRLISRFERLGDLAIILGAFVAAYYGRDVLIFWNDIFSWGLPFAGDKLAPLKDYFVVFALGVVCYYLSLSALGAYQSMRLQSGFELFRISLLSSVVVFICLSAALFLLKIDLSRSLIALFCTIVCLTLGLERIVVLQILRFWRRQGRNFRNLLVCGTGHQAIRVAKQIASMPELGMRIRGFAQLKGSERFSNQDVINFRRQLKDAGYMRSSRVLVGKEAFVRVIEQCAIDEVIFADVVEVMPEVEEMVLACSEKGVRTTLVANLFSLGLVQSGLSFFGEVPLIHFQTPPGDGWQLSVKRLIDIIISGVLLVLSFPLLVGVALAIRLSSPGPVLFMQRRVGLNGRLFYLYKFRSMNLDAAKELESLKAYNEMQGPTFKMKDDPRVTPLGKLLRRFSLDELPQLWNVFVGDMSLVGPRPPIPGEVDLYDRKVRRRLSMRPGITCTWQVTGRNDITDFDTWVKLDLEYIDNWSLGRDLMLLLKTIPAVLSGSGR